MGIKRISCCSNDLLKGKKYPKLIKHISSGTIALAISDEKIVILVAMGNYPNGEIVTNKQWPFYFEDYNEPVCLQNE